MAGLLPDLILREITLPPRAGGLSHEVHVSSLSQDENAENAAVDIVDSFGLLVGQLASLPLGSSAGGFTYAFDDALGTFVRTSRILGPSCAERATTIGRGGLQRGVQLPAHAVRPLRSIKFCLRHQECCTTGAPPVPPFSASCRCRVRGDSSPHAARRHRRPDAA